MNARQLIEAEDPKRALRANPEQGLGYRDRPVDYDHDYGWNFLFGTPIRISFNIVARDMAEAVTLANAHFHRIIGQGGHYLNDELDTGFFLNEQVKDFQITDKQLFMYWPLFGDQEEDPIMNPSYEG